MSTDPKHPQDPQALASRVDSLVNLIQTLRDELEALRDDIQQAQQERDTLHTELDALQEHVHDLEDRTNLLRLADRDDTLSRKERTTILIQHLYEKAEKKRDRGDPPKAQLDKDGWEDVLHNPALDRTNAFKDLQHAADRVSQDDILWYENGVLRINLESVDARSFTDVVGGGGL